MTTISEAITITNPSFDLTRQDFIVDPLFTMELKNIKTPADLRLWQEHNVLVADYLAMIFRNNVFEPESKCWEMYVHDEDPVPPNLKEVMGVNYQVQILSNNGIGEVDFTIPVPPELPVSEQIIILDENHPRARLLKSLTEQEELPSNIVMWIADYIGVPTINVYTAGQEQISNGIGGHALALVRTPYQDADGTWACDVFDPMKMQPNKFPLNEFTQESAWGALARRANTNKVGDYLMDNHIDFDLITLSERTAFERVARATIDAGTAGLQEKDIVNCQFMAFLIQAYRWSYELPESVKQVSERWFSGVELSDLIASRFKEVFDVEIKSLIDIATVPLNDVPEWYKLN